MFILKADNLMMAVGGKTLFNASIGWIISEHRHAVIKNELNRLTNLLKEKSS
ncbi:hypothetical protein [Pallidibacillus pasinlerensis]|uniref:Uncharacterized protein n=1 Tax=Pallidibacillus pasinlerensis TaxID=2703818 RepID=A0ABX0A2Y1_9BACI|nr:hypothetical protein [Pallidibacillus pasinlerensis]NCU17757.1 hypothetical protein [Pallidibacillus pasinlerensis]